MIFTVKEIEELEPVADKIIQLTNEYSIFCFYGNLGAGKTTLIKLICEKLNVVDTISSPTYPIINEYNTIDNRIIYHIDLYRLKSIEEALNIGIEEYLYSGNLCLIEWPDNFKSILPATHFNVKITKFDESRTIEMVSSIQ
ncbi:MAG: tRNA (adenosine(37)-N6)-threonylcarbamoyltransferase complex ATPase subunit type 1 TsaE [Chitinophagales bacterium]